MQGLALKRAQAEEVLAYDEEVEKTTERLEHDLTHEQESIARKMTHTGQRDESKGRASRKPKATKQELVAEVANFIQHQSGIAIENFSVPNPQQKIRFYIAKNDRWYSWTLTEHRTEPK